MDGKAEIKKLYHVTYLVTHRQKMKKLNIKEIRPLLKIAIEEDLGQGDLTSELLFPDEIVAKAHIISREEIIVCGMGIVREILRL